MDLKEMIRQTIEELRIGNGKMIFDPDRYSRAETAVRQNDLLDLLESFMNACKISEKEDSKD
nr:MAG TPA: hypothetical protein [Caudoviricetes sp.]